MKSFPRAVGSDGICIDLIKAISSYAVEAIENPSTYLYELESFHKPGIRASPAHSRKHRAFSVCQCKTDFNLATQIEDFGKNNRETHGETCANTNFAPMASGVISEKS
ncbi:hypothetical protein J6590_032051 [Homalodisca vitripennis]|nr:hypothetical protein J6590_032051 [Homalodisca vitripennis]